MGFEIAGRSQSAFLAERNLFDIAVTDFDLFSHFRSQRPRDVISVNSRHQNVYITHPEYGEKGSSLILRPKLTFPDPPKTILPLYHSATLSDLAQPAAFASVIASESLRSVSVSYLTIC